MFSLQRFIAKDERVFDLLEESAEQGRHSIRSVIELLRRDRDSLEPLVEARRKGKRVANEIREHLVQTFLTPLDREDIETLSNALYKIPKTAEKFSERYLIAGALTEGADFSRQVAMLEKAGQLLVPLVQGLRAGRELSRAQAEQGEIQQIEGDADKLMLLSLRELYHEPESALRAVAMKDLYELLEKVFDRCRDAGNAVFMVALKYS